MADNNKKTNKIHDLLQDEANISIYADHMGLTPAFVKANKDKLQKIEDNIRKSMKYINNDNPEQIFNTLTALRNITERTYYPDNYEAGLDIRSNPANSLTTRNDMKLIYGQNDDRGETEIYNFSASIFSNYRNLVTEYRNIARLIPEINRCADMKSRDILAINEHTKRAISNVYAPDPNNRITSVDKNSVNNSIAAINRDIDEQIIDKYELEENLPRWIMTSLIEGAKPVVIYPYRDIVDMANYNMSAFGRKYQEFNMKVNNNRNSAEGLMNIINEYEYKNNKLIPDFSLERWNVHGVEDKHENSAEEFRAFRDDIINKYISKEDLNEYFNRGLEDINEILDNAKNRELVDIYGSNSINKKEQIEATNTKFNDLHAKVRIDGDLGEHFKNQIFNAIKRIDDNIEFFDQTSAPLATSIQNFRRIMQFTGYYEDPAAGLTAYGAKQQAKDRLEKNIPNFDRDPLSKFNDAKSKGPKSVLDGFEDEFEENTKSLLDNCLVKEYDAEDVIPIIVSGKHIGYYAIEVGAYTGNYESINKRNCNFTDMFINLGIANDLAMSPSPASSGSYSAGVQNIPMGGVGPASELSTLGVTGAGSTAMAGGMDIAGFDIGPAGQDAVHRNNIMKKIMFNVLKHKIKQHDINDDETFTNTIMSLIREGAIVQNKVKIVYIPEKYMCYFTPGLDGNGIPQSFMKNCLFTCYEAILVNMNNIMTRLTRSGTRDKITVNIGKAKNMGYSIRAIENALTTRRLNIESPFTSLDRVLKAASLSETIIVPAFDGETLFQYEDLTQTNTAQPQDDLEQKLKNDIVTSLKCPITITNPYQEEDFASLAASRNAEYRFDIIKQQKIFSKTINKCIKTLYVGDGLYEAHKNSYKDLSLKDFSVILSAPETLNMKNSNDTFGTVQQYIENIINLVIDPDDDTETVKMQRFLFKQRLYQKYMPALQLDDYIEEASALINDAEKMAINKRKDRSANDQIVNSQWEPILVDEDGSTHEPDGNKGVGSSDEMGSW